MGKLIMLLAAGFFIWMMVSSANQANEMVNATEASQAQSQGLPKKAERDSVACKTSQEMCDSYDQIVSSPAVGMINAFKNALQGR